MIDESPHDLLEVWEQHLARQDDQPALFEAVPCQASSIAAFKANAELVNRLSSQRWTAIARRVGSRRRLERHRPRHRHNPRQRLARVLPTNQPAWARHPRSRTSRCNQRPTTRPTPQPITSSNLFSWYIVDSTGLDRSLYLAFTARWSRKIHLLRYSIEGWT